MRRRINKAAGQEIGDADLGHRSAMVERRSAMPWRVPPARPALTYRGTVLALNNAAAPPSNRGRRPVDGREMADAGAPWPRRCAGRSPLTPAGSSGRTPRWRIHVTTTWCWTSWWMPAPTDWVVAAGSTAAGHDKPG